MAPRIKPPSGIMTEPKTRLFDMVDYMLAEYGLKEPPREELKPCPFCGCEDLVISRVDAPLIFVCCPRCDCRTPNFPTDERANAIAAWNRRYE